MSRPRYPDFYIIGAPKCGTTALYNYLSENPSIFMPVLKEPHYFAHDFPLFQSVKDEKAYLDLFCKEDPRLAWGEASVWYLYSSVAIAEIARVRPDAKLIVMLRNPVDAVESMHAQHIIGFAEDIYSFQEAWRAQFDRALGRRIPMHCPEPAMLQYGEMFAYANQLHRVLASFPAKQVKVVIYEEFFRDPERNYGEIMEFLGVAPHSVSAFQHINPGRAPQNIFLHRLIARPPFPFNLLYKPLYYLSRKYGLHLGLLATRLTRVKEMERPEMSRDFRREVESFFADDIAQLENLLGRKLDAWHVTR